MAQNFTPKPKQRHMYLLDLCEFKSSLDYRASFLVNWGYIMRPCFQTNTKNTEAKLNRKKNVGLISTLIFYVLVLSHPELHVESSKEPLSERTEPQCDHILTLSCLARHLIQRTAEGH